MIRILTQGAIVVFFLVMMTLLFQYEVIPRYKYGTAVPIQTKQLAEEWVDIEESQTVFFNGFPVGVIRQSVYKAPVGVGYEGKTGFLLRSGFLNADLAMRTQLNQKLEVMNFSVVFDQNKKRVMTILGRITPDRFLSLKLESPTGVRHRRVKLNTLPTLNLASTNILELLKAQPNSELQIPLSDPLLGLNSEPARVRLGELQSLEFQGREVFVSVVEMRMSSVKSTLYYDPLNKVIRREINFQQEQPGNQSSSVQALPSFSLRMDATTDHPLLPELDALMQNAEFFPEVTASSFAGEDSGDVQGLLSLPTLLLQQSLDKKP
ncbi:MAG: hypothetical protein SFY68_09095 [Candidatus Sumerlaeia bacterium]|nr:hypothetical protein [Candidatus Sumerlaeia bacterium]